MNVYNRLTRTDEKHQFWCKVSAKPLVHLFCIPSELHLLSKFGWNLNGTFKIMCACKDALPAVVLKKV